MGVLPLLFVLLAAPAPARDRPSCPEVDLFRDDFSRFPPGWLTRPLPGLGGAIQEYHHLPHRGLPLGPWANAITHLDAWLAGDEDGRPYVEQHTFDPQRIERPLLVTGDPAWDDVAIEAEVRPLSLEGAAGVVFRYHTNRHHYAFVLEGGRHARLTLHRPFETAFHVPDVRELGRAELPHDSRRYRALRVEARGDRLRAFVDGALVIEARDGEIPRGKAGLVASGPARFRDFRARACPDARTAIEDAIARRAAELRRLRSEYPRPRLWRRFRTPGFGAGRNVRFGHLDGDGQLDMLIAQNVPRGEGDGFCQISALTAVTLSGRVLWRSGRADRRNGRLTSDTPFQIHDLDGDGRGEVVLVRDYQLQILDGATGRVLRKTWMPPMLSGERPPKGRYRPFERHGGDALALVNAGGGPRATDILVKDRYKRFWVFDAGLQPRWRGETNTGHFPFPVDLDGDGRDEIAIGYSLWDAGGRPRWDASARFREHADGVAVGNFSGDPGSPARVYWSASDEGVVILDLAGNTLRQVRLGHAQNASVARYRRDLPGLQYMTVNFWHNPGIVTLLDANGTVLAQEEPSHAGSLLLPVNWRGDGEELALLSGSPRSGGLLDGHLRRAVVFPDDGHPDLAAAVLDVTGDARDEILLWDEDEVWIYTQDRPAPAGRLYAPRRNPHHNDSNYRTVVSWPAWADSGARASKLVTPP